KQHTCSIDVHYFVRLFESLGQCRDHVELPVISAIDANLRSVDRLWQIRQKRRQRRVGVAQNLEEPRACVDRIVIAEVAVREEEVSAHLACHRGARLFHLGLYQRVPGFPHYRIASVSADVIEERLRALHFGNERGSGCLFEDAAGKENHQLIAPDDIAPFVYHAYAIGVAVKRDRKVRTMLIHSSYGIRHVFDNGRIRMVIRKAAISFTEQLYHIKPHAPVERRRDKTAHAVTCVYHYLQRAFTGFYIVGDVIAIGIDYFLFEARSAAFLKLL